MLGTDKEKHLAVAAQLLAAEVARNPSILGNAGVYPTAINNCVALARELILAVERDKALAPALAPHRPKPVV